MRLPKQSFEYGRTAAHKQSFKSCDRFFANLLISITLHQIKTASSRLFPFFTVLDNCGLMKVHPGILLESQIFFQRLWCFSSILHVFIVYLESPCCLCCYLCCQLNCVSGNFFKRRLDRCSIREGNH